MLAQGLPFNCCRANFCDSQHVQGSIKLCECFTCVSGLFVVRSVIHIHSKQNKPANCMQIPTLTIGLCFLPKLPINVYLFIKETSFFVFNLAHQAPVSYGSAKLTH